VVSFKTRYVNKRALSVYLSSNLEPAEALPRSWHVLGQRHKRKEPPKEQNNYQNAPKWSPTRAVGGAALPRC